MRFTHNKGFTLVELVVVIVITGIIAASIAIFFKPAIDSYLATQRRAELTDMADTALRRMATEVRGAVSNSIQVYSSNCFRFVPTIAGGRYRMADDIVTPGSAFLDTSTTTTQFDVLSPLATLPAPGDWVVINNQNGSDVYAGNNRGSIQNVSTPPNAAHGLHRITLNPATQFPSGYFGGRFTIVRNTEQTVYFSCVGNVLYRITGAFSATASTCSLTSGPNTKVVATDIAGCNFVYDPNQGATQQSGFLWMNIKLTRSGESIALAYGVHVNNVP